MFPIGKLHVEASINTILALLAVAVVIAAHAVLKLLLPFRALRGLFRHSGKPAGGTAG